METLANFFIFNVNGDIVGNPKGYRTLKGAERQANSRPLCDIIEAATAASDSNLLYEIKHKNVCKA